MHRDIWSAFLIFGSVYLWNFLKEAQEIPLLPFTRAPSKFLSVTSVTFLVILFLSFTDVPFTHPAIMKPLINDAQVQISLGLWLSRDAAPCRRSDLWRGPDYCSVAAHTHTRVCLPLSPWQQKVNGKCQCTGHWIIRFIWISVRANQMSTSSLPPSTHQPSASWEFSLWLAGLYCLLSCACSVNVSFFLFFAAAAMRVAPTHLAGLQSGIPRR